MCVQERKVEQTGWGEKASQSRREWGGLWRKASPGDIGAVCWRLGRYVASDSPHSYRSGGRCSEPI